MIIKTYKTRELKGYTLHLMIDGKLTTLEFGKGCGIDSKATYTTSNPKIQQALESLKAFGPTFYIDCIEKIGEDAPVIDVKIADAPVVEEEKEVVDMLDAKTFKNLVELRNALKDKGIDVSQITNVKAAESIAKKNGYNYTVEKNA